MFNVVGDELRKLNERLERIEGELMVKDGLFSYRQSMNVKVTAILAQLNKFQQDNEELAEEGRGIVKERGERLTRIESQLTALRAEADKGRVALSVQFEARMTDLDNMLSAQWLQAKILHEFTNKRLKAMESAPRKKKQERKKGRK